MRTLGEVEIEQLIYRFEIDINEEDYQSFMDSQPARKYTEEQIRLFTCAGCRVNTLAVNEYYMVQFEMWHTVVPKKYQREVLCIGCLEGYLGRKLVTEDFIEAPINYRGPRSERLKDRMGDWFVAPLFDPERESVGAAAQRLAVERGWL